MSDEHASQAGCHGQYICAGEVWQLDRVGGAAVPGDQASAHPWTWPPAGKRAGPHSPTRAGKLLGVQAVIPGHARVINRSEGRM